MEKTGLFEFIPSDHLYFCILRSEKAPICEKLGVTHFVDDRTEVLSHMKSVPFRYAMAPTAEQLIAFPPDGMKVVQYWGEAMEEIEHDLD